MRVTLPRASSCGPQTRPLLRGDFPSARGKRLPPITTDAISTAFDNGAMLEDVQKAAGHRDPSTTKLYDRRGYDPEKAASFFARY